MKMMTDDDGCSRSSDSWMRNIRPCPSVFVVLQVEVTKGVFYLPEKTCDTHQDKYGDVETGDTVSHWKRKWCTLRQS